MNRKNIRMVSHGYHYFFVRPGRNKDLHAAARKLMGIRKVREVEITEGDYGFVIRAHDVRDGDKAMVKEIAKAVGGQLQEGSMPLQVCKELILVRYMAEQIRRLATTASAQDRVAELEGHLMDIRRKLLSVPRWTGITHTE